MWKRVLEVSFCFDRLTCCYACALLLEYRGELVRGCMDMFTHDLVSEFHFMATAGDEAADGREGVG